MPDTSNQSVASMGPCNTSDNQWSQEISSTDNVIGQDATPQEWNQLPAGGVGVTHIPAPNGNQSEYLFPNGVNNINVISPPSYYNVAYQRNGPFPTNGFTTQNPPRGLINQNGSNYLIRNTLNGTGLVNGTNIWPNQKPIGRFVGQQQTWAGSHRTGGVRKQKRIRTAFSSSQMMELEQEYNRTRYLDRTRRLELAESLRLNERTIKIWFQNRRMKEKKIKSESLEESDELEMEAGSPKMGSMLIHEQSVQFSSVHPADTNYEMYREGAYVEQYPVTSAPVLVSQPPVQPCDLQPVVNDYPNYVEDQSLAQYQQLHFQLQHYAEPFNLNVEELSPESTAKSENSSTIASSDVVDKSWDLSWIRSINSEEDY